MSNKKPALEALAKLAGISSRAGAAASLYFDAQYTGVKMSHADVLVGLSEAEREETKHYLDMIDFLMLARAID
ncbi:hypothetical protein A3J43_00295 [Candidatus Uhrbacteria bacterium RIFCSPHIGHO2_12_FULL_54_23]|uniref:Uncharacterized protein n=3 Tax=Candidatus Uhriibacteriota TaxID=1752732 RepID=A0A1F7UJF3_9BACT|nr:MAG: hypothetical protein A3J43_00295 [Candidatus Uhrbacteria bacterium RIFCSPHIGHO2_12_FULL_54_23]OGL84213.1 MAG: hypothetical protein A3B36_00295 [Candidatus Uhrbacteria bacterium RIFCSPLOWO2_01_FULL_55_36]OGL90046.1 MAG: hypothetical protein A3J36_00445 [Candidatus Uhrbacteria bacterium RIFCSPLOWO2_02_FULL_54_37]